MIKLWAEKEFRNLKRIMANGKINSAEAVMIKSNVLLMKFIGKDMDSAPKLKDITL